MLTDELKTEITTLFNNGLTHEEIGNKLGKPRRTIMKLCKVIGLKRSTKEAAELKMRSKLDTPETVEKIKQLRNDHSLQEIVAVVGGSISAIERVCQKYSISVDESKFDDLQSERMKQAWTNEKKEAAKDKSLALVTDELKKQISESSKKLWLNPEYRANQIEVQRRVWSTPEKREQLANMRLMQGGKSKLQTILYSMLDDLKVKYYKEYDDREPDQQCIIGPYNFDCVIPREGQKTLLIECNGDYWHSMERHVRLDRSKFSFIVNNFPQYEVKYLWEHEFKCYNKVLETLKYWLGIAKFETVDFDFDKVTITRSKADEYKLLLSKYHYLSNAGKGGIAYGAYLEGELIAVCVFSDLVRQNIVIEDFSRDETRELSRLCVHPRYQKKNFSSWFVSRCIKLLPKELKCIVSYCDTTFNHNGAIYKALNFQQDSVVRPDYWYADSRGWVMHKKTLYNHAIKMGITENEYADKNGYKRIYGAEKLRFIYKR